MWLDLIRGCSDQTDSAMFSGSVGRFFFQRVGTAFGILSRRIGILNDVETVS